MTVTHLNQVILVLGAPWNEEAVHTKSEMLHWSRGWVFMNNFLFTRRKINWKICDKEWYEILLSSIPNVWIKLELVQGNDCKILTFKICGLVWTYENIRNYLWRCIRTFYLKTTGSDAGLPRQRDTPRWESALSIESKGM